MTADTCACGRPIHDQAVICGPCGDDLKAALASIAAYRGLGWDLDLTLSRQARIGDKDGPRSAEHAIPYDARAGHAAAELKNTLATWARVLAGEQGPPPHGPSCRRCDHGSCKAIRWHDLPADTLTAIAAWLAARAQRFRHHPAGAEAREDITGSVHRARRAVDRAPDLLYAGPCDGCGEALYTRPGRPTVTCRTCELDYDSAARRDWLLRSLDDYLANSQQAARLVGYLGITVPDSTIRWYAMKQRILAHGLDQDGRPLYRLGDIVRTYLESPKRRGGLTSEATSPTLAS